MTGLEKIAVHMKCCWVRDLKPIEKEKKRISNLVILKTPNQGLSGAEKCFCGAYSDLGFFSLCVTYSADV